MFKHIHANNFSLWTIFSDTLKIAEQPQTSNAFQLRQSTAGYPNFVWPSPGLVLVADKYMIVPILLLTPCPMCLDIASAFTVKTIKYITDLLRSPEIVYGKIQITECMTTEQQVLCHSVFLFPGSMVSMKYTAATWLLKRQIPSHGLVEVL